MLVERCSLSIGPPFQITDGIRSAAAEPSERTANSDSQQETRASFQLLLFTEKGTGLSRCL